MARPRTGRQTSAEYQRRYRERKKLKCAVAQANWMLDARLTNAIRHEAKARGIHESELADEILGTWYEARFGGRLFPPQETSAPAATPEPKAPVNGLLDLLTSKLEEQGFVVPLQGMSSQCLHGDATNGLWATVTPGDLEIIEFGLTERVDGSAITVLHCIVDTVERRASLYSDVYADLNQNRDMGAKGLQALADVFERLLEFRMAKRLPLQYNQIVDALPSYLSQPLPKALVTLTFQRFGLELICLPPTGDSTYAPMSVSAPQELALHDLRELARHAKIQMQRARTNNYRLTLADGGELVCRAITHATTKLTQSALPEPVQ